MAQDDIMNSLGIAVTVLVLGFVILQVVSFMNVSSRSLHNEGQIITMADLGVYQDEALTQEAMSIDWGTMLPDETKNCTVYMRNEGASTMTLSMTTQNWQPSNASDFIMCSWNMDSTELNPSEVVAATFTLHVFQNITGINSFQFNIIIIGGL